MRTAVFNIIIAIIFALPSFAFADEEVVVKRSLVEDFKECRGLKSDISPDETRKLFEKKLFPGPFDPMGEFISRTEKLEAYNRRQAFECPAFRYTETEPPSNIEKSLANIVRETSHLLKADIEAQRTLLEKGEVCSRKITELTKATGKRMSELKISDFKSLKGGTPDDEECAGFNEKFVPELADKLNAMRLLMVIRENPKEKFGPREAKWGDRVRHDMPFAQDLAANFFPTVWKNHSLSRLRGLSETELEDAKLMAKIVPQKLANEFYYQILSSNPILLFFDKEITPDALANAFTQMKSQSAKDLEKMVDEAPQEIMLMLPYVRKAIAKTPVNERGNACAVVGQIFENLNKRYEQFPRSIAQVGLVFSVIGGLGGSTVKEGAAILTQRAGWTAMAFGGVMAKDSFSKYSRGVAMCSVQVVESHLCDFKDADKLFRRGQDHVVGSALSGTLMFGIGRVLRPAL